MTERPHFVRLEEVADFMGGSTPSRATAAYFGGGIPWVKTTDLNNSQIVDTEETLTSLALEESSCKIVPAGAILVAMYGGFKQIGRTGLLTMPSAINQALTAVIPNPAKLDAAFLQEWLNFRVDYWKRLAGSSRKDPNITKADVADFPVPIISVRRQQSVCDVLCLWNRSVDGTERLIEAKRSQLLLLRERFLGAKEPQHVKLRDATRESISRNGATLGRDQIMGVTNDRGIRPMREEKIASSIDRYKIVHPSAFAYNPMRLNVGSIAMSPFDRDVLVSPDYVVFECDEAKLLPGYLNHLRLTRHWASFFDVAGSGSVRVRIYYDDLAAFSFPLPSVEKQRRAVDLLDAYVAEIEALARYAEALRRQKRGLMQQLLTGKWRVPIDEGVAA